MKDVSVVIGIDLAKSLFQVHRIKPYVKRSKNDASDAEAICEAVTRPTLRFVGVKSDQWRALSRAGGRLRPNFKNLARAGD